MAVNSTISNFIRKAATEDFARNNLFRVMSLRVDGVLELDENDLLYAKGGKLPARSNPTAIVQYMGMELPYNTSTVKYDGNTDYQITFFVDKDSTLAHKFEVASRVIFNDISSTGKWNFPQEDDVFTVAALGFDLEPIEYITFHGIAFKGFQAIDFNTAEGDGSKIEIVCNFSYLYYRRHGSDVVVVSH